MLGRNTDHYILSCLRSKVGAVLARGMLGEDAGEMWCKVVAQDKGK